MLLGVGTAGAQDQHSGGVSPNNQSRDPGTEVLGNTVTRGGGLPVTGSDVAGMVAIGAAAVAAGAGAVTVSKRRSARLSA
jgi:LPXTG-motif cell wall-anchored protein